MTQDCQGPQHRAQEHRRPDGRPERLHHVFSACVTETFRTSGSPTAADAVEMRFDVTDGAEGRLPRLITTERTPPYVSRATARPAARASTERKGVFVHL